MLTAAPARTEASAVLAAMVVAAPLTPSARAAIAQTTPVPIKTPIAPAERIPSAEKALDAMTGAPRYETTPAAAATAAVDFRLPLT
ncbi:hypothetical protein [Azospirillum griseum]|uniref:Uncharacterized protein n=1 Tax=Azospirillum griseum TaxID=2496639 RepID=A0A3S0K225_9PROT|nr:hypothetical protein [Azospirillum griseum]RTR16162.1 hypothetical protein EJ903_21445 [Azospirillum griseum]